MGSFWRGVVIGADLAIFLALGIATIVGLIREGESPMVPIFLAACFFNVGAMSNHAIDLFRED